MEPWFWVGAAAGIAILGAAIAIVLWTRRSQRRFDRIPDSHDLWLRFELQARHYAADRPGSVLVAGFLQKGREQFATFGDRPADTASQPDEDSLFEIGSITATFTALAVTELAQRGVMSLDDPVTRWLTDESLPPQHPMHRITLRALASHASGLPEFPDNLEEHVVEESNPYAEYTSDHLFEAVRHARTRRHPRQRYQYSNFGYGLLGCLMERVTGLDYQTIVQEIIGRTLQLRDTTVRIDAARAPRFLSGHHPGGAQAAPWDFDGLVAAGGLRSSARDLLTLVRAQLRPESCDMADAIEETQRIQFQKGRRCEGLGWHIMNTPEGLTLHWQNGATGGFVGFVGFDRQHRNGLVLLSNHGDAWKNDDALDALGLVFLKLAARVSLD